MEETRAVAWSLIDYVPSKNLDTAEDVYGVVIGTISAFFGPMSLVMFLGAIAYVLAKKFDSKTKEAFTIIDEFHTAFPRNNEVDEAINKMNGSGTAPTPR